MIAVPPFLLRPPLLDFAQKKPHFPLLTLAYFTKITPFQLNLQQKHLDTLELYVTDDKGRLLAEVDPRQADLGLMSFKCVLRWDHIMVAHPPAYVPTRASLESHNHVPEP